MNFEFHYHSERARKSRFKVNFSKSMRHVLIGTVLVLCVLGLAMFTIYPFIGSALLSLAVIGVLPYVWYAYDIDKMKPISNLEGTVKIEDAMASDVVGRLRSIDSPKDIWKGLKGTWQQRVFCIRYSISPEIFEGLDDNPANGTSVQVLNDALILSVRHGEKKISAASTMVALIKSLPNNAQLLGQVGLDLEELETSIDWVHHSEAVLDRLGNTKHFGGLARDWTSGYTPMLNRMAHNMSIDVESSGFLHRDLGEHAKTVNEMVKFMSGARPNVLLVGDVGVGKTITTYGFAQKILIDDELVPANLRYHQVFLLSPSSIISASGDRNRIESIVEQIVYEVSKAKNAILFFDDAESFFTEGTGAVDLSKLLMPLIESGVVPMIFAMTPGGWQRISQSNQALAGLMNYLAAPELDRNSTLRVLEDQSLMMEVQHGVHMTYQALVSAIDLSGRYVKDVAYPGKAISVLENSVNHVDENKMITAKSVQESIEVTQGVKVQVATGVEKESLLNLEQEIHKHMINQTRAVKVVADALRRARSGVNNPNKPIGTFLFLGPTGVGKTELSKSVAQVYFGDAKDMVRVDMNEFTQSSDVARLLDVSNSSSLLSVVGRNKFTVVLFDEIEKAHPEVVNVFLQLLDEGVMRDVNNREVSFRDAIVIATSNAGADSIRAYIDAGKEVEEFEDDFIDSLINSSIFKPEFINRFDETVVFRPLKQEELFQVVDLLMNEVNSNLAKQKVSVTLDQDAKAWLVERGYDPRLGARPLRRMVQRSVENVVAKKILSSDFTPGSNLNLTAADLESEAGGK